MGLPAVQVAAAPVPRHRSDAAAAPDQAVARAVRADLSAGRSREGRRACGPGAPQHARRANDRADEARARCSDPLGTTRRARWEGVMNVPLYQLRDDAMTSLARRGELAR